MGRHGAEPLGLVGVPTELIHVAPESARAKASLTLISSVVDNVDNGSLLTGWCGNPA
jgi:hypothetical protein